MSSQILHVYETTSLTSSLCGKVSPSITGHLSSFYDRYKGSSVCVIGGTNRGEQRSSVPLSEAKRDESQAAVVSLL